MEKGIAGGTIMKDEERKIYGGFLIVPLKYDDGGLNTDALENVGSPIAPTTMDLNENVKAMLNHTGRTWAGSFAARRNLSS